MTSSALLLASVFERDTNLYFHSHSPTQTGFPAITGPFFRIPSQSSTEEKGTAVQTVVEAANSMTVSLPSSQEAIQAMLLPVELYDLAGVSSWMEFAGSAKLCVIFERDSLLLFLPQRRVLDLKEGRYEHAGVDPLKIPKSATPKELGITLEETLALYSAQASRRDPDCL